MAITEARAPQSASLKHGERSSGLVSRLAASLLPWPHPSSTTQDASQPASCCIYLHRGHHNMHAQHSTIHMHVRQSPTELYPRRCSGLSLPRFRSTSYALNLIIAAPKQLSQFVSCQITAGHPKNTDDENNRYQQVHKQDSHASIPVACSFLPV